MYIEEWVISVHSVKYLCPLYQISGHSFPAAHSCWEVLRGKHLLPFQTLAGMVNSYMHIQFFRFLCHNFQSISSWRRQPQGSDFSIMKHPRKWIPVPDRIQDLQERQIRFYPHRHWPDCFRWKSNHGEQCCSVKILWLHPLDNLFCQFDPDLKRLPFLSFSFFLIINKKERSRGVETSILSTCNNYKLRWKSNGVFFNRFFGGFVLRATLKSNFVASAMSCSIIEISLLRL